MALLQQRATIHVKLLMNLEIQTFIEQSDYYRDTVSQLAGMLPADDTALDLLIDEAVAASDQTALRSSSWLHFMPIVPSMRVISRAAPCSCRKRLPWESLPAT